MFEVEQMSLGLSSHFDTRIVSFYYKILTNLFHFYLDIDVRVPR